MQDLFAGRLRVQSLRLPKQVLWRQTWPDKADQCLLYLRYARPLCQIRDPSYECFVTQVANPLSYSSQGDGPMALASVGSPLGQRMRCVCRRNDPRPPQWGRRLRKVRPEGDTPRARVAHIRRASFPLVGVPIAQSAPRQRNPIWLSSRIRP